MSFFGQFEEITVAQALEQNAASHPDREFITFGDTRLTYGQVDEQATALAASLTGLGVTQGDRVALLLPNWPQFVVSYFAIAKSGAILVALNMGHKATELEATLRHSGSKLLITVARFGDRDYGGLVDNLRARLPDLQHVVIAGAAQTRPKGVAFEESIEEGRGKALPSTTIDCRKDVFVLGYTSSPRTGQLLGAMLTHDNLVWNAAVVAELLRCTPDDVFLSTAPLFNVVGWATAILSTAVSQARMVLIDDLTAEHILSVTRNERVTVQYGWPSAFIAELNHPRFAEYDCSSLRTGIVTGAPCPVDVVRHIRSDMGCDVAIAYGLVETSPFPTMTHFENSSRRRAETVGHPLPDTEIRIVDEDGQELPRRARGELICRGRGVMKGYYDDPEETAQVLDEEGWLWTGDLATMDEHGYVRIVGRKKEMIARGDEKVYPQEIEKLLRAHPKVQEVAIIGLPDEALGEITCACVQLRPGEEATTEEITGFCRGRLADFKVPDKVVFLDSLPMTSRGRVRKSYLQERVEARPREGSDVL